MKSNFILPFLFSCVAWFAMAQNKAVVEAENYFNMGRYCEAAEKCADAYSKLGRKGEKAMILKGSMAFKTGECYRLVDKFKEGKPLKGYELPGLWNGAMANWITVFVEVPLITFNPVKTVNDLLKPAHQQK